jgi:hypothetical protein
MPLTPPGLAGALIPALYSSGNIGIAVPLLALGVGTGICTFAQSTTVISVDAGTLGVGATVLPLLVPQPAILGNLIIGFAAVGNVGIMTPSLALGLSVGLNVGFLQGLITMVHPTVGLGTGVAKFIPSGAVPSMIAGFAAVGMVGPGAIKTATGIGIALTALFAEYTIPVPIVGPPSPAPGAGAGVGKIV